MKKLGYIILAVLVIALILPIVSRINQRDKLKNKQNSEMVQESKQTAPIVDSVPLTAPMATTSEGTTAIPDTQKTAKVETQPVSNNNSGNINKTGSHGGGTLVIITTIIVVIVIVGFRMRKNNKSNAWSGSSTSRVSSRASRVDTLGSIGRCKMCGIPIFGEETVVETQKRAIYMEQNMLKAHDIEQQSGYRCTLCRSEYCKECLEKYAETSYTGGQACPSCRGNFEIIHG